MGPLNHVALIPDGNRRWAKNLKKPTWHGHRQGLKQAQAIINLCPKLKIKTFTIWAFSTENWRRSTTEIKYLMKIFQEVIKLNLSQAQKTNTRIYHLGRSDRLPKPLLKAVQKAVKETAKNTKFTLNLALDYGGQDEIRRAISKYLQAVSDKKTDPQELQKVQQHPLDHQESVLTPYLDTARQKHPYPDLIIRTSGEQRTSGFLTWQAAYSELVFSDLMMPDFGPDEFKKTILDVKNRTRKFGGDK